MPFPKFDPSRDPGDYDRLKHIDEVTKGNRFFVEIGNERHYGATEWEPFKTALTAVVRTEVEKDSGLVLQKAQDITQSKWRKWLGFKLLAWVKKLLMQ